MRESEGADHKFRAEISKDGEECARAGSGPTLRIDAQASLDRGAYVGIRKDGVHRREGFEEEIWGYHRHVHPTHSKQSPVRWTRCIQGNDNLQAASPRHAGFQIDPLDVVAVGDHIARYWGALERGGDEANGACDEVGNCVMFRCELEDDVGAFWD